MICTMIYVLFICLSYGQIGQLPFDVTEQFSESIALSTSTPIIQETLIMTRSVDENKALFNVTILFDDGNGDTCFQGGCLNPTITISAEHSDLNSDSEYFDIWFGSFVNTSDHMTIGRCGDHPDSDACGVFTDCVQEYQPPAGCYDRLKFWIFQSGSVDTYCSGSEGQPVRSLRLKITVSCDAAGQCEESECGEGQDVRRRLGGNLLEDESVEPTTYDLELECKAYDDVFTGFLVFVAICWIGQCGAFYVYKIK